MTSIAAGSKRNPKVKSLTRPADVTRQEPQAKHRGPSGSASVQSSAGTEIQDEYVRKSHNSFVNMFVKVTKTGRTMDIKLLEQCEVKYHPHKVFAGMQGQAVQAFDVIHRQSNARLPSEHQNEPLIVPPLWTKLFLHAFEKLYGAPMDKSATIPHTIIAINGWVFAACLPEDRRYLQQMYDDMRNLSSEKWKIAFEQYGKYIRFYASAKSNVHRAGWSTQVQLYKESFATSKAFKELSLKSYLLGKRNAQQLDADCRELKGVLSLFAPSSPKLQPSESPQKTGNKVYLALPVTRHRILQVENKIAASERPK